MTSLINKLNGYPFRADIDISDCSKFNFSKNITTSSTSFLFKNSISLIFELDISERSMERLYWTPLF